MFDLDFGIKVWYKKPTFFIKLVCGLLTFAYFIYLAVLISMTNDAFFPIACTRVPKNLGGTILFFLLLSVVVYILYVVKLTEYKLYCTATLVGTSVLVLVLSISYSASYYSYGKFEKYYRKAIDYCQQYPDDQIVEYFRKKTNYDKASSDVERRDLCFKYLHNRLGGASPVIIWLSFCIFGLFSVILIDTYVKDDETYNQME